jgi:protein O-GlcNAc transferase
MRVFFSSNQVTHTREEYEELAVTLALDMDKLWELRKRLEDGRETCPLFDTARWVRNAETGFKMIWTRHEQGKPPGDVDVPDFAA